MQILQKYMKSKEELLSKVKSLPSFTKFTKFTKQHNLIGIIYSVGVFM